LVTPDLDLIIQAEQGCGRFGEADPSILGGRSTTAIKAGDFAADLLQEQQMGGVTVQ
jgi:hypothetical protein